MFPASPFTAGAAAAFALEIDDDAGDNGAGAMSGRAFGPWHCAWPIVALAAAVAIWEGMDCFKATKASSRADIVVSQYARGKTLRFEGHAASRW